MFWEEAAKLEALIYIDRVPTDSNPADLPSRKNQRGQVPEPGKGGEAKRPLAGQAMPSSEKGKGLGEIGLGQENPIPRSRAYSEHP